jgi:hypothetical protein
MEPCIKACKQFENTIKNYQWTLNKDLSMIKMYVADRKAMKEVLSLYKKMEWKKASDKARKMDTAVREYIPDKIWNDIQNA